jgi:GT2 family glycosyltransferase
MTSTRFSLIVPVFNKAPYLQRCLASWVEAVHNGRDSELIVIDHSSTDGSSAMLRSASLDGGRVMALAPGTIAAARNFGAAHARGRYLCFIDADCLVPPDYLKRLEALLETSEISATGCSVGLPPSPSWVEEVWHRWHKRPRDGYRHWLSAANLTIRRDVFETIGGFDERLVTHEDIDLCRRIRESGAQIWEARALEVAHLDNPRTVREFVRKETWRASGMVQADRGLRLAKPTLMTLVHLTCVGAAVVAFLLLPLAVLWRAALGLALFSLVPAASVAYRAASNRTVRRPLRAFYLYHAYYLARVLALVRLARGRAARGPAR